MSRDELVAAALLLAFAGAVTVHVAILAGLVGRKPRWRAALALVLPPLAPYWAWGPMRRRAIAWLALTVAYGVALLVASR
jgi:hypothetical protein